MCVIVKMGRKRCRLQCVVWKKATIASISLDCEQLVFVPEILRATGKVKIMRIISFRVPASYTRQRKRPAHSLRQRPSLGTASRACGASSTFSGFSVRQVVCHDVSHDSSDAHTV